MTRKCSYCSHHGHNSRTCTNRGVKIFGVRLIDGSIRKSASMGNLSHCNSNSNVVNGLAGVGAGGIHDTADHGGADGYASEDFVGSSSSPNMGIRKKGVAWTEEEHRMFLLGLHKLGKGDWRGISKNYVISRTPTQVASHAQKYFIRQTNVSRRKRRSSLFDIVPDDAAAGENTIPKPEKQNNNVVPIPVSSSHAILNQEVIQSMDYTNTNQANQANQAEPSYYPFLFPPFVPSFIPYPVPIWTSYGPEQPACHETHQVVKPLAAKQPINVDELVEMSKLRIVESNGDGDELLSLKLMDGSTRQSAFHPNSNPGKSNVGSGSNAIHAV